MIKRLIFSFSFGVLFFGVAVIYQLSGKLNEYYFPIDLWAYLIGYPAIKGAEIVFRVFNTNPETTLAIGLVFFFFQFSLIGYLISLFIFKKQPQEPEQPQQPPTPTSLPINPPPTSNA